MAAAVKGDAAAMLADGDDTVACGPHARACGVTMHTTVKSYDAMPDVTGITMAVASEMATATIVETAERLTLMVTVTTEER